MGFSEPERTDRTGRDARVEVCARARVARVPNGSRVTGEGYVWVNSLCNMRVFRRGNSRRARASVDVSVATRERERGMDDADADSSTPTRASAIADGARGAVAGVSSRFVTHPLDTLKARAQVRGAMSVASGGAREVERAAVVRSSVIRSTVGLYAGFGAVAAFAPVASGAYFAGYESGRARLGEGALASAATGMWAQALAGIVYTPMDVIKERLQTQDVLGARQRVATYRNWMDAARVIAREEGARGLFRGYWAQNFVWWPWSATYFVLYERSRAAFAVSADSDVGGEAAVSPTVSSACATFAASAATTLTHPLDLAKTRLQTMRFESSSLVRVLSDVIRREGIAGVFAGVGARVAAVAPGSAISFFVYESLKKSGW